MLEAEAEAMSAQGMWRDCLVELQGSAEMPPCHSLCRERLRSLGLSLRSVSSSA